MKKQIRQYISMLLVAVMTIAATAGCGRGKTAQESEVPGESGEARGRYIETQLSLPEDGMKVTQLLKLSDGTLAALDETTGLLGKSSDGGVTWEMEQPAEFTRVLNLPGAELGSAVMNADGEIFLSYNLWEEVREGDVLYPEHYEWIDAGGNVTSLDLTVNEGRDCLSKSLMSEDGTIYSLSIGGAIYEIDPKNQRVKKLFASEANVFQNLSLCGNQVAALTSEKVFFYHCDTGEEDSSDTVLNEAVAEAMTDWKPVELTSGEGDSLYMVCESGLYSHVPGGSVMERLIDGSLTTMGDPSRTVTAVLQEEDGSFLVAFGDGALCSYTYDENARAVPQLQLSVYSLADNATVRQAISVIQKENQDLFVKLEIGMTGEDGMTSGDAIKALNTRLLAGEGPDVILLDGMPMDSYGKKGMLMDLSDLMKEIEAEGNYFTNITHVYDGDGFYGVPFRYMIPVMTGEHSSISGVSDLSGLAALVEKSSGNTAAKTVLGTYTPEETLKKLYLTSSPAWVREDKTVDTEKLTAFLEAAKRIYDADQKKLTTADIEEHKNLPLYTETGSGVIAAVTTSALAEEMQIYSSLMGEQLMTCGSLGGISDFQTMQAYLEQYPEQSYKLAAGQAENVLIPNGIVGISAVTDREELAKAFVKTLLSEEVQSAKLEDGYPVNADAFDVWTVNEKPEADFSIGISTPDGEMVGMEVGWPKESAFAELKNRISSLNTPCLMDTTIQETVLGLGKSVLTGEKSVEDCVDEIMQKLSIYQEE